jgi:hypothetical protein
MGNAFKQWSNAFGKKSMTPGMKKSAAFAAALLAFLASAAPAADPIPPPTTDRYGVRLDLRAELSGEEEVSFRGNWHHRILFANYGATQLIPPHLGGSFLTLAYVVTDSEGRPVTPAEPPYNGLLSPLPQSASMYGHLARGELLGFTMAMLVRQLVPGPGTYRVVARLRSPVPASFAPSEEVWTTERGPIESNPVTIRVIP